MLATTKHQAGAVPLPRLVISDGTLEAIKWTALVLMVLDHVNKYLLHDSVPSLFAIGRAAMPLFGFVLAYNLARPESLVSGAYRRVALRLAFFGAIASVPFIGLGGLGWGWWPLNIMVTFLVATGTMYCIDRGGYWRLIALCLFLVGGASVEFWWPAIALIVAAWSYVRSPSWPALGIWMASTMALYFINGNLWALTALVWIFAAPLVMLNVPRLRSFFYVFYPAHLALLWLAVHHM